MSDIKFLSIMGAMVLLVFCGLAFLKPQAPAKYGSSSDNKLQYYPTATKVWVTSSDSLVVASNTARTYLEVANISGSTTTPQALYCNFGDRASVVYEGTPIQASSSKIFMLDNLYTGALRCRFPSGGGTVDVTDF
jgi:hypothetical protein